MRLYFHYQRLAPFIFYAKLLKKILDQISALSLDLRCLSFIHHTKLCLHQLSDITILPDNFVTLDVFKHLKPFN